MAHLLKTIVNRIYKFCGSLKLAVIVITSLASTLGFATFYESVHGTKATQAHVYQTTWFSFILLLLGVNIACSAAQRFPWKKRQAGFVVAHAGILTVLFGSALTRNFGIDGTMPLAKGEVSNIITIDDPQLEIWDNTSNRWLLRKEFRIERISASPQHPYSLNAESDVKLIIEEALSKATAETGYLESADLRQSPALLIEINSDATGIHSQQWLKANDPQAGRVTMGLADVSFAAGSGATGLKKKTEPHGSHETRLAHASASAPSDPHASANPNNLQFLALEDGTIRYSVASRAHGRSSGTVTFNVPVTTGWRDFKFKVLKVVKHAEPATGYIPITSKEEQFNDELPSALFLKAEIAGKDSSKPRWLSYGDSAEVELGNRRLLVRYGPRFISLPFALRLNNFEVGKYPGTERAMTYTSDVQLIDPNRSINKQLPISMNEPLTHQKFTFYQASFQETENGPISVLSVGRDPGRVAKYLGSILLVLGIIIMYTHKWMQKRLS